MSWFKTPDQLEQERVQREKEQRIIELKRLLLETDYVTLSDYDQGKPEIIQQRQSWREEIRLLEQS